MFLVVFVVVLAFYLVRRRLRFKRLGLKSYQVFRFVLPSRANKVRAKAHKLDDDALLGAYHVPEHRPSARQIIREELAARGYDDARVAAWRRPTSQITIPSTVHSPIDREHYFKLVHKRRRDFRVLRFFMLLLWIFTILAIFTGFLGMDPLYGAFATAAGLLFVSLLLFIGCVTLLGRNRAVRILLLRPFGARAMTKPLKRVVLRNIGTMGYVFTLADRNYKPNLLLTLSALFSWLPRVFVGPFLRQTLSFGRVANEGGFFNVIYTLSNKLWLSANSLLTGGQAFTIRCSNSWWQSVIDLLMHSSDIVIMDVSRVSEGSSWEIHRLEDDALVRKCIFIVHEQHLPEGNERMAVLFPADARPELFIYDEKGHFKDQSRFATTLENAVAAAAASWGKQRPLAAAAALAS
jgi:uncharacterized membrane protein (DUF485 family)